MTHEQIFDAFNELDTELREKGAKRADIISAVEMLLDALRDEEADDDKDADEQDD